MENNDKNIQVPQSCKTAVMQSVMENIKVQENYFYNLDNLKEVKIIWKKYDKANVLEIGIEYPTAIVDLDRFTGIELNDDWLIKLGFQSEESFVFELDDISINTSREMMWIFTKCKNSNQLEKPLYVHELQNIYFALTGRELTVA